MFIDEGLAGFFLGRVERVYLSDLRDKGVLEFDGMVEGTVWGKDIIGLLEKTSAKEEQKSGTGMSLGVFA